MTDTLRIVPLLRKIIGVQDVAPGMLGAYHLYFKQPDLFVSQFPPTAVFVIDEGCANQMYIDSVLRSAKGIHVLFIIAPGVLGENFIGKTIESTDVPDWVMTLHNLYKGRVYLTDYQTIRPMHLDYAYIDAPSPHYKIHWGEAVTLALQFETFPLALNTKTARFLDDDFWRQPNRTHRASSQGAARRAAWERVKEELRQAAAKMDWNFEGSVKFDYDTGGATDAKERRFFHKSPFETAKEASFETPKPFDGKMTWQRACAVLGVDGIDKKAIKRAFRLLAKKYHPDNQETGDEKKMQEINVAYEYLIQ